MKKNILFCIGLFLFIPSMLHAMRKKIKIDHNVSPQVSQRPQLNNDELYLLSLFKYDDNKKIQEIISKYVDVLKEAKVFWVEGRREEAENTENSLEKLLLNEAIVWTDTLTPKSFIDNAFQAGGSKDKKRKELETMLIAKGLTKGLL